MYSPFDFEEQTPANSTTTNIRMVDAISDGLKQSMQKYPNTVVMGQDIAEYGGVFKITDGFIDEFGKERYAIRPFANQPLLVPLWDCPSMAIRPLWKCSLPIL